MTEKFYHKTARSASGCCRSIIQPRYCSSFRPLPLKLRRDFGLFLSYNFRIVTLLAIHDLRPIRSIRRLKFVGAGIAFVEMRDGVLIDAVL